MDIGEPLQIRPLDHNYNINEVLDAIQRVEKPTVHIVEQPASRALRFRYKCEGRSAGSIPGASSTPENRTFPTIEVTGYRGPALVVVSCVTADEPYRPHPHKLVGRDDRCAQGVCKLRVDLAHSPRVAFTNLGVQCVKRRDVEPALKLRRDLNVDPFNTGFDHMNEPQSIDLNVVRLCFQVILLEENGRKTLLEAAVTQRVYDKKALSELAITRLSRCSASAWGGEEVILLCEKVSRDDVEVYFYEAEGAEGGAGGEGAAGAGGGERGGERGWQAAADVLLVHKQVAVVLLVPRYPRALTAPRRQVFVELRRKSDNERSKPVPFEYIPQNTGTHRPADFSVLAKLLQADSNKDNTDVTVSSTTDAVTNVVHIDDDDPNALEVKENTNDLGRILDDVVELDDIFSEKPITVNDLGSSNKILEQAFKNPMKISDVQVCDEDVEFVCEMDKRNNDKVLVIGNDRLLPQNKINVKDFDQTNKNRKLSGNTNKVSDVPTHRVKKRNRNSTETFNPAFKKRSLLSSLQKSTKGKKLEKYSNASLAINLNSTSDSNTTGLKANSKFDKSITFLNVEQDSHSSTDNEAYTSFYDIDSSEAIIVTESVFSVGEDEHYALYRLVPRDGDLEDSSEIYAAVDPTEIFH